MFPAVSSPSRCCWYHDDVNAPADVVRSSTMATKKALAVSGQSVRRHSSFPNASATSVAPTSALSSQCQNGIELICLTASQGSSHRSPVVGISVDGSDTDERPAHLWCRVRDICIRRAARKTVADEGEIKFFVFPSRRPAVGRFDWPDSTVCDPDDTTVSATVERCVCFTLGLLQFFHFLSRTDAYE